MILQQPVQNLRIFRIQIKFSFDHCDFNLNLFSLTFGFEDEDEQQRQQQQRQQQQQQRQQQRQQQQRQVKRWIIVCWKPQTSRFFASLQQKVYDGQNLLIFCNLNFIGLKARQQ